MKKILYEVTHTTSYNYVAPVGFSQHLLRLAPRKLEKQFCLSHEFEIAPQPAVLSAHADYFGNPTHFISVEKPHQQLVVTSKSRIALSPAFIPDASETPRWEEVRAGFLEDLSGQSLEAQEFVYDSELINVSPEYAAYAQSSFPPECPILEGVTSLTKQIHQDFTFDACATAVETPVAEVFKNRRGVCQDFAQLQIAFLRSLGLPARYVSGYLETDPPPGQEKLRGVDASHAWVSFYCPGIGWIDIDPTNNCFPSLRHITIAWGRDYFDVAPIRGALIGGDSQNLSVSVDVAAKGDFEGPAVETDLCNPLAEGKESR